MFTAWTLPAWMVWVPVLEAAAAGRLVEPNWNPEAGVWN